MQKTLKSIAGEVGGTLLGSISDKTMLAQGVSTDTRSLYPNQLYVPILGDRFDGHDFLSDAVKKGAVAALWQEDRALPSSPSIPLIRVKDTLEALQQLAAAWRREIGVKVVAVTGSNGKTTTKELLGSILSVKYRVHRTQGNLNNHIGLPLTLLSMPRKSEVAVVEMGMNHAGEIALLSQIAKPDLAVITNIGEAHIEHLGSRQGIADAKLEICEGLAQQGTLVIDGDEPLLRERLVKEKRRYIRVGWKEDNDDVLQGFATEGLEGISFTTSLTGSRFTLPMMGQYNAKNALLAITVGRTLGLTEEELQQGLNQVHITGMRLEKVTATNGMLIINDAYNASPSSMRATIDLLSSLDGFKEKWVLLGDMLEMGPEEEAYHREVGRFAMEKGISRVYAMGARGRWIVDGAQEVAPEGKAIHFQNPEEAAQTLLAEGNEGVVLLVKASRGARLETTVEHILKGAKTF
ncbi:UDP-N-acetylmuramoyl-tripeptide--D-alanyl-D-alanine ligase [Marininema mesophilum]|uniref:UDP-N-acetylmuramoyl-tripeptide--D-alanyl-D-alanine ligase n=1 Tax=Marininema mesophilum TaxID=1048340 RepID=A0A1H2QEE6_9BACL|nr:UDP-N-acetylmuramoyl-tripeptide--D-alanyl-D-alanine ligase [Marininema mesophilum]SDW05617.1 UDP-N-acetylmuramoyl-tripeptide--D-alanyl-D-alanine ligase [Marininema mesophilum]